MDGIETSRWTAYRTWGSALFVSAAFLGLFGSRFDVPWWVKALGALVMVGLTFVGFHLAFHRRDDEDLPVGSDRSRPEQPW